MPAVVQVAESLGAFAGSCPRWVGGTLLALAIAGSNGTATAQDPVDASQSADVPTTAPDPTAAPAPDDVTNVLAIPESRQKLGDLVVKQVPGGGSGPPRHPLFELAMWVAAGGIVLGTLAAGIYLTRVWLAASERDSRRERRAERKAQQWAKRTGTRDARRGGFDR